MTARAATKPRVASRRPKVNTGMVADVRRKLGLNRKLFARLVGFSERAIANWEAGAKPDEPGATNFLAARDTLGARHGRTDRRFLCGATVDADDQERDTCCEMLHGPDPPRRGSQSMRASAGGVCCADDAP